MKLFRLLLLGLLPFSLHAQQAGRKTEKSVSGWQVQGLSVSHQSVSTGNGVLNYTASAGYMPMKDERDSLRAKLFFTAYTKDGDADASKRPVIFAFNGGPGSSSVWLHMGLLGPRCVVMTADGQATAPPYRYTDNPLTWLDKADLVFIDPMMTGFTRPAPGVATSDFTGYDNDIRFVGDFIRRYLTRYNRWSSPKFLAGESYGTTRAAGLAGHLQDNGIYLNGIILISAILNFETVRTDRGNDLPFPLQLPTFAATAWYHHRLDPKYKDLKSLLREVEEFSIGEYSSALLLGDKLPADRRAALVAKLQAYTGLTKAYIEQTNLRLHVGRFNKELLRSRGLTIGRFDSRITGRDYDDAGEYSEADPSYDRTVYGTYTGVINDYLRRELHYESDLPYEILTGRIGRWEYPQGRYLNVADELRSAMVANPHLKVWVCNGYYDMATPYFATDYVVHHVGLPAELRSNVTMTYYEGGHMMYTLQDGIKELRRDFVRFMEAR